jgi:hypothetical protein
MSITAYATFVRFRSWNTVGQIFASAEARSDYLRLIAAEECENVPEDADDVTLVDLLGMEDHEVHLFQGDVALPAEDTSPGHRVDSPTSPTG